MPSKNGMFEAVWSRHNPETGEAEFALHHEDFEAIRLGYGCGTCLADFHGIYHLKCPVCGESRPQPLQIVPEWWSERPTLTPGRVVRLRP